MQVTIALMAFAHLNAGPPLKTQDAMGISAPLMQTAHQLSATTVPVGQTIISQHALQPPLASICVFKLLAQMPANVFQVTAPMEYAQTTYHLL